MRQIDFNCDLGEGCGSDADIVPLLSSASIACGGHAGDAGSMRDAIALSQHHGVAIGAHPSFEDRSGFGRRDLALDPTAIHDLVTRQLTRFASICEKAGAPLHHVKPHGALYNLGARDRAVANAIASAVAALDPAVALYALSGSRLADAGHAAGLRVAHEVFAERAYDADGSLAPRGTAGTVIEDIDAAIEQVRHLIRGVVVARDGSTVQLRADTLCLHGDRQDAAGFARALRAALEHEGLAIRAPEFAR